MKHIFPLKFFAAAASILLTTQASSATIYLQAKQYLDVQSGQLIHPANLLIKDGKITAINPATVPATAAIIKKPNLILLPGLMDMHVHLPIDSSTYPLEFVQDDAGMATVRAVKNAKILLLAGFTTIRCVGQIYAGPNFIDIAVAKAGENGWIPAPHIISAGNAIGMTGGIMDPDMVGGYAPNTLSTSYRNGVADGADEIVKAARYQIKYGAKVIKIGATDGVLAEMPDVGNQEYTFEEMKAVIEEANRHDIPVAAHAHGTAGINAAIKAGASSIEHGSLLDDESISLMKKHGTYLVPTTYADDALNLALLNPVQRKKAEYIMPLAKQNLKKAIQENVKIAFGTDSPVIPHGENAKEFAALVRRGMKPIDAIRTSTINAADLLRRKDIGQIKVGYHADIIGVTENPLINISSLEKIQFVMKDGEVYKE